jgi:hypothetical protein
VRFARENPGWGYDRLDEPQEAICALKSRIDLLMRCGKEGIQAAFINRRAHVEWLIEFLNGSLSQKYEMARSMHQDSPAFLFCDEVREVKTDGPAKAYRRLRYGDDAGR